MFTSHSACPTTDNPPFVPGTYQVLHPPALNPVRPVAFRCKLSEAPAKAREAKETAEARYKANH